MLKVGIKGRRTMAQIKEDQEEEAVRLEEQESQLAELASLRARIQEAEQQAETNKGAADLLSQMINAGHVAQSSENSVVINSANGAEEFKVGDSQQNDAPQHDELPDQNQVPMA